MKSVDLARTGLKIKKLMSDNGVTVEYFAEHMNVSVATVYKWRKGAGLPDIDNLCTIADFFNVAIEDCLEIVG